MSNEAVDNCLAPLKFTPDGFVPSKKLENNYNALHPNDIYSFIMKILIKSHLLLN